MGIILRVMADSEMTMEENPRPSDKSTDGEENFRKLEAERCFIRETNLTMPEWISSHFSFNPVTDFYHRR